MLITFLTRVLQRMAKPRVHLLLVGAIILWVALSVLLFQMLIFSQSPQQSLQKQKSYHRQHQHSPNKSIIQRKYDEKRGGKKARQLLLQQPISQSVQLPIGNLMNQIQAVVAKAAKPAVLSADINTGDDPELLPLGEQSLGKSSDQKMPRMGVLMIACNRTYYLRQSLGQLIDIRANTISRFAVRYGGGNVTNLSREMRAMLALPLMVSLDCDPKNTLPTLQEMAKGSQGAVRKILLHPAAMTPVPGLSKEQRKLEGYYRIARHYHWAVGAAFRAFKGAIDQLIVVEDDLTFSPDFFEYFLALGPLLAADRSLMCVSAWNDNGKSWMIEPEDEHGRSTLHRTDFFPGLGWLLSRRLWEEELADSWPAAFWDDWLRHWTRMRNRTCIRPEISRTSTIGEKGVSKGQFFSDHLQHIQHSRGYAPFFEVRHRLWHQLKVANYETTFRRSVYEDSKEIEPYRMKYLPESKKSNSTYRITYYTRREFEHIADMFGLMRDFKVGVPRTAYMGVVSFIYHGYRVFLAPPDTRKAYIKEWN